MAINPIELHLTTIDSDGKEKGVEFVKFDNLINVNVVPGDELLKIHIFNRQKIGGVSILPKLEIAAGRFCLDQSSSEDWVNPQQSKIISSFPSDTAPFRTSNFLLGEWLWGPGGGMKISFAYQGKPSRWTRILWGLTNNPFDHSYILRLATQEQLDRYRRESCLEVLGRSIWTPERGVVQLLR